MGASHSKKDFKIKQKSGKSCPGCGVRNDFVKPSGTTCKWHTKEKEEAIFRKLNAANVQFVTLKNPTLEERNKVCELVTFLEMLVAPQPQLEPIAVEYAAEIKEFFEITELCEKRQEGEPILFHGMSDGCEPCAKANKMLNEFQREHFLGVDSVTRLFSLHRPAFPSPSVKFENVENLTLEISEEASAEIKRRLVEHYEVENMNVRPRGRPHAPLVSFEYMKETVRMSPYVFDLRSRFPNLKMLTIMDHSFDESSNKRVNYDLIPHFLLPESVRVLRVNKNVLDTRAYGPFLSRISGITDLLIDFMPDEVLSVQEPPLLLDKEFKCTILDVKQLEHMDASALSKLRRLRITNATLFDQYAEKPKYDTLSELMSRFQLPETLESFELPVTSGMNPFVSYPSNMHRYTSFTQLAENLRCVYSPNIRCIDLSTPFNLATIEVKADADPKSRGSEAAVVVEHHELLNMWEQHEIILNIISAFEICYFEDVILHIIRNTFKQQGIVPFFKNAEAESIEQNLTRNLHLLLSGSQFVLQPRFVENVVNLIQQKYASVIERSTSKLNMFSEVMTEISSEQSVIPISRLNKQTLDEAVDVTFVNKLKRTVLKDIMAVKPKYGEHSQRVPRDLESRSVFAFSCKTPVCELARTSGLLSRIPSELLPRYRCVDDDEYDDSDDEGGGRGCGNEWNVADARPCRCFNGSNFGKRRLNPHIAFDPNSTFPRLPFSISDMRHKSYLERTVIHIQDAPEDDLEDFVGPSFAHLMKDTSEHHDSKSLSAKGSSKGSSKGSPKSRKSPESKHGGKGTRRRSKNKVKATKRSVNRKRKHKTKKI
jgi:hypothetical protein